MKIRSKYLLSAVLFVSLCCGLPAVASAGTIGGAYTKNPKPSTEADDYNPNSDPLPEWLLLPNNIDENQLVFTQPSADTQKVTYEASGTKWIMTIKNGKKVTYAYYVNNKPQLYLLTNNTYSKVVAYDGAHKKLSSQSGMDYFDGSDAATTSTRSMTTRRWGEIPGVSDSRKSKLSVRQLKKLAHYAGFRGHSRKIAVAVARAESGRRVGAVLCNSNPPKNPKHEYFKGVKECGHNSADRGLWQINNYWHKSVGDKCAFSSHCTAKATWHISNGGREWQWWSTYQNGDYKQYL